MMSTLTRLFVASFTLVLLFFPTISFEWMEDEGDVYGNCIRKVSSTTLESQQEAIQPFIALQCVVSVSKYLRTMKVIVL